MVQYLGYSRIISYGEYLSLRCWLVWSCCTSYGYCTMALSVIWCGYRKEDTFCLRLFQMKKYKMHVWVAILLEQSSFCPPPSLFCVCLHTWAKHPLMLAAHNSYETYLTAQWLQEQMICCNNWPHLGEAQPAARYEQLRVQKGGVFLLSEFTVIKKKKNPHTQ